MLIKKIKNSLLICIITCMGLLVLFGIGTSIYFAIEINDPINKTYRYFTEQWDIELPAITNIVYENSETGWFGDGIRYRYYEIDSNNMEFISNGFSHEKDTDLEDTVKRNLKRLMSNNKITISEDYLPRWDINYYWLQKGKNFNDEYETYDDNLIIIYDPTNYGLYICESFY